MLVSFLFLINYRNSIYVDKGKDFYQTIVQSLIFCYIIIKKSDLEHFIRIFYKPFKGWLRRVSNIFIYFAPSNKKQTKDIKLLFKLNKLEHGKSNCKTGRR